MSLCHLVDLGSSRSDADVEPLSRSFWEKACFQRGTRLVMSDGTQKKVEDIVEGDELLGALSHSPSCVRLHLPPSFLPACSPIAFPSFLLTDPVAAVC